MSFQSGTGMCKPSTDYQKGGDAKQLLAKNLVPDNYSNYGLIPKTIGSTPEYANYDVNMKTLNADNYGKVYQVAAGKHHKKGHKGGVTGLPTRFYTGQKGGVTGMPSEYYNGQKGGKLGKIPNAVAKPFEGVVGTWDSLNKFVDGLEKNMKGFYKDMSDINIPNFNPNQTPQTGGAMTHFKDYLKNLNLSLESFQNDVATMQKQSGGSIPFDNGVNLDSPTQPNHPVQSSTQQSVTGYNDYEKYLPINKSGGAKKKKVTPKKKKVTPKKKPVKKTTPKKKPVKKTTPKKKPIKKVTPKKKPVKKVTPKKKPVKKVTPKKKVTRFI